MFYLFPEKKCLSLVSHVSTVSFLLKNNNPDKRKIKETVRLLFISLYSENLQYIFDEKVEKNILPT